MNGAIERGGLRVCHVTTMGYIAAFVLQAELAGLQRRGCEVHLVVPPDDYAGRLEEQGFRVHRVVIPRTPDPLSAFGAYRRLRRLFERESFDVVHTHQAVSGVLGRIAAHRSRVPLVIHTEHGLPAYRGQPRLAFHFYRWALRLASRYCDLVLSENLEDLENLVDWGIAPAEKVAHQGTGIDLAAAEAAREGVEPGALRRELDLPRDAFCFVMAARFEPVKNHELLFRALDSPWFVGSDAVCVLAGTGELEESFRARARAHPAGGRVRFLGFRNDLQRLLPAFDAFVLTSVKEGVPHVIQEASFAGLPVVATDVLGTREAVRHGETGFLVPLGDADALAAALGKLEEDEALRTRLGTRAQEVARDAFSITSVIDRLEQLYRVSEGRTVSPGLLGRRGLACELTERRSQA